MKAIHLAAIVGLATAVVTPVAITNNGNLAAGSTELAAVAVVTPLHALMGTSAAAPLTPIGITAKGLVALANTKN